MPFYLLGLIVVLLLKMFVHNRDDAELEWVKRILEVPADAAILSLMAIVAASASGGERVFQLNFWILLNIAIVLFSIVLYKYGSKNISYQSGEIAFDNRNAFIASFLCNSAISIASVLIIYNLGVF